MTITIPVWLLWLPVVWVAVGLVLWLPLEYKAYANSNQRGRRDFWAGLWKGFKRRPYVPLLCSLAWPYVVYEELFKFNRKR